MKIKFLVIALLIIPVILTAQIQWQDNGVPIRSAENLRWFGDTVELTDGSIVVLWRDTRDEDFQIFAQRIDENGNELWEESGINISNSQLKVYSFIATASSDGNFLVAFFQSENDYNEGYLTVQKINPDGEPCWTTAGVSIYTSDFENKMCLNSDDNGGVYLLWSEYYDLKGIRFDSDGLLAAGWDEYGNIIYSFQGYTLYDLSSTTIDGDIVCSFVYGDNSNNNVKMQRTDMNGNNLWGIFSYLILSSDTTQREVQVVNSPDGFWVGWENTGPASQIVVFRFYENGTLYWNSPLEINLPDEYVHDLLLRTDSSEMLYTGWYEENEMNYHIAKIDENQNMLWGDEGITAFSFNNEYTKYYEFQTTPENEVNFVCVYAADYYDNYLYFDRFDASGLSVLSEPLELNHKIGNINFSSIDIQNNSNSFVSWAEFFNGDDKLKYQILNNQNQPILTPSGETIFSGSSGTCSDLKTISMNNKSAVSWLMYSNAFLQTINNDGTTLSESGIQINGDEHILYGDFSIGYDDSNQRILSAWNQDNEDLGAISLQAVNEAGNLLWGENGITVTNSELEHLNPQISALNGNAYIGWTEYNGDWLNPETYLYVNKLDADGNIEWGENGILLYESSGFSSFSKIIGRFLIWEDDFFAEKSIHAILLDENGNLAPGWEEGGLLLTTLESTFFNLDVCEVPGGYFIAWRAFSGDDADIRGQLLMDDGEIIWEQGGIELAEIDVSISGDNLTAWYYNDKLYVDWKDHNCSTYLDEIHLQKFNLDGNPSWSDNGIVTAIGSKHDFLVVNDNILVVYDYYNGDDYNIGAKLFSTDGEELWEAIICDKPHDQRGPVLSKSGENNIVISWLDNRDGIYSYGEISSEYTEVYAQNIYIEPTYTPDDILNSITAELHQNYPNPFNPSTTISFSVPQTALFATIEIFNLKGQKVKTLECSSSFAAKARNSLSYSVTWNGTDDNNKPVSSGIYFYRLKAGTIEKSRKMLLLK